MTCYAMPPLFTLSNPSPISFSRPSSRSDFAPTYTTRPVLPNQTRTVLATTNLLRPEIEKVSFNHLPRPPVKAAAELADHLSSPSSSSPSKELGGTLRNREQSMEICAPNIDTDKRPAEQIPIEEPSTELFVAAFLDADAEQLSPEYTSMLADMLERLPTDAFSPVGYQPAESSWGDQWSTAGTYTGELTCDAYFNNHSTISPFSSGVAAGEYDFSDADCDW